jgi:hypothetical protein
VGADGQQFPARGGGELVAGWPALQQLEDGRRAQVVAGDGQGGREGRQQVLAQPVEQAALVAGGAVVVAGDRPEFAGQLTVGDQGPQRGVSVKREQAGDAGILGVVLLRAGPRRRAIRSGLTGSTV